MVDRGNIGYPRLPRKKYDFFRIFYFCWVSPFSQNLSKAFKIFEIKKTHYLRNNEKEIAVFDTIYMNSLERDINKDEAMRYAAMKPFRDFVMTYYKPVNRREFGTHKLYERK